MKKIWLVIRHEIRVTIFQPAYFFFTFVLPLAGLLLVLAVSALQGGRSATTAMQTMNSLVGSTEVPAGTVEGFVDYSGIIIDFPAGMEPVFHAYPDESSARDALQAGEIGGYYIVPAAYLETGEIVHVSSEFTPFSAAEQSVPIKSVLDYNLLDGDTERLALVQSPAEIEVVYRQPNPGPAAGSAILSLPFSIAFFFLYAILFTASLLLNSIQSELANRTIEVLMISLDPRKLFAGKMIALCTLGLLEVAIWMGTSLFLLSRSGGEQKILSALGASPQAAVWGVVLFLLGYALYASLLVTVGVLLPGLRESSSTTMLLTLPLYIPVAFFLLLVHRPQHPFTLFVTFFPFSSPVAVLARMMTGTLPAWQLWAAAGILLFTTAALIYASGSLFRVKTLLSGQKFSFARLVRVLVK